MQTERQREAAEFRANGSQRKQEIQRPRRPRRDRAGRRGAGQGRHDPRRGRGGTQPHLRRGLRQGPGLLRLLSLDAGLRGWASATRTPAWCCGRIPTSSAISPIRAARCAKTAGPTPRRRQRPRQQRSAPRLRARRRAGQSMADFIVALGLVFVIEGLIFAASPSAREERHGACAGDRRRPAAPVGIASAVIGVVLVWLVRGRPATRRARAELALRAGPVTLVDQRDAWAPRSCVCDGQVADVAAHVVRPTLVEKR